MDMIVSISCKIEIDDSLERVGRDVQTAGRYTSCNKHQAPLSSEVLQDLRSFVLGFLAVECADLPCLHESA